MANQKGHTQQGGFIPPVVNMKILTMSDGNIVTDEDESSQDSDASTSQSATTYTQVLESNSNHSLSNDSTCNQGGSTKKTSKARNSRLSVRSSKDFSKVCLVT